MRRHYLIIAVIAAVVAIGAVAPVRQPPLQEQVDKLTAQLAALTKRVEALEQGMPAEEPEAKGDPDAAMREFRNGKIAAGQTLQQVTQLAGARGTLDSEADGIQRYKWNLSSSVQLLRDNQATPLGSYTLLVEFRDGKVIAYRKVSGGVRGAPATTRDRR